MNLHLYQYNNYFNRTIKPLLSWQEMDDYEVFVEYNINFSPNDGISTSHIIGGVISYNGTADYCILEDNQNVISRWFVIENRRTRSGQYEVLLKRDTVGEYQDVVFAAPCFIEKGWVSDTDPAIFNHENLTFNQIKQSEVLLKDKTGVPWLVGYYLKDNTLTSTIPQQDYQADYTINGISNWEYYDYVSTPARIPSNYDMLLKFKCEGRQEGLDISLGGFTRTSSNLQVLNQGQSTSGTGYHYSIQNQYTAAGITALPDVLTNLQNGIKANSNRLFEAATALFTGFVSQTEYEAILDLADRTIYDSAANKLYKIGWTRVIGDASYTERKVAALTSNFGFEMYNIYSQVEGISGNRPTANSSYDNFALTVKQSSTIQLTLTEQNFKSLTVSLSPQSGAQTTNSPYNIFALPYGEFIVGISNDGDLEYHTMDKDMSMRICMDLISKYSGTNAILLDVQLLPYCPVTAIRANMEDTSKPIFLLSNLPSNSWTTITDSDQNVEGVVFYCTDTQHSFSIDYSIPVDDIKISNETEFCRLLSPNWNSMFEFAPAKNLGVEYFEVDYDLKPFQPYIHIAPKWNEAGLYGKRDKDAIGLICSGDFGLTMMSEAWATYERQNKNYQQIFDRQIQNLEVQQKWQLAGDIIGAGTGTFTGATGGAMMGSMIGGGVGGGIGAGVGAATSAIGGAADIAINQALRAEAMDYTKDLFGYQMGNIKALPNTLTKVNSFNSNNTIFPILEFYSCTLKEKEALVNKIIYNGMSVGRIGQLRDFINPLADSTYVKGQIIILDGLNEDSHFATDIANEINKGVRI